MRIGISILMSGLALLSGFFLLLSALCLYIRDFGNMLLFFVFAFMFGWAAWRASAFGVKNGGE